MRYSRPPAGRRGPQPDNGGTYPRDIYLLTNYDIESMHEIVWVRAGIAENFELVRKSKTDFFFTIPIIMVVHAIFK